MPESGCNRAGAPESALSLFTGRGLSGRPLHHAIVLEIGIRVHVERRRDAEVVVKPEIPGPRPKGFIVVGLLRIPEAQVPFTDAARSIPPGFQKRSHGHSARLDQAGRITPQHTFLYADRRDQDRLGTDLNRKPFVDNRRRQNDVRAIFAQSEPGNSFLVTQTRQ